MSYEENTGNQGFGINPNMDAVIVGPNEYIAIDPSLILERKSPKELNEILGSDAVAYVDGKIPEGSIPSKNDAVTGILEVNYQLWKKKYGGIDPNARVQELIIA